MKISYNWLKEYLNFDLKAEEVAKLLTFSGLEVSNLEKYQTVKGGLDGLVIGEVKTKMQHPNADRLSVTTVDTGNGNLLKIVCGAPNVAAGQKVVVATVGTTLYPTTGEEFKIKKSKIRGEESEGMICAEDEIGLGKSHDGIMVLNPDAIPGTPANKYFNIDDDRIFEIELTPNRIDAASHIGVARDLMAILHQSSDHDFQTNLKTPGYQDETENFKVENVGKKIEVFVENPEACSRYSAVTLSGIEVKPSPSWLQDRLKSIGQKPINNIVDITNFVLHECGQPLHAFDAEEIQGNRVIVKTLPGGTKFTTLDGKDRILHPDDLMICNEKEGMCIAGIFGGIKSGVSEKTKNIFLESAHFNPTFIRKTSKRHDFHTEASFRFERGSDVNITVKALKRAALLIKEVAGGTISSEIIDVYPLKKENAAVVLEYEYCNRLIGKKIDPAVIKQILTNLQIIIKEETKEKLFLSVPPFRVDVQRPADLVEEILRIYGYNNVEIPQQVRVSIAHSPKPDKNKIQNLVSDFLSSNGFSEIMSNSLSKADYYNNRPFLKPDNCVKILNPLSAELNVLRQNLLFSGLEAIAYNQNRKKEDLKLFEFGNTYHAGNFSEEEVLSLFLTGRKYPETWNTLKGKSDFFNLKELAVNIFTRLGLNKMEEVIQNDSGYLSNVLSFELRGKVLATIGKILPEIRIEFDLKNEVYYGSFHWAIILNLMKENNIRFKELPKFPPVRRDLAMVLEKKITYAEIEKLSRHTVKNLLSEINLFDVFEDEKGIKIPAGKKSYAVSFTFLDEGKTLTDAQVEKLMDALMESFEQKLGAQIRRGNNN